MVMFLVAQVIVFVYCGSDWLPHDRMVAAAHALPESPWRAPAIWAAERVRIFNNAGVALSRQVMHNAQGHRAYLLGDTARRAFWYYFPVALTIKMTLPMLLLLAAVAIVRVRAMFNWPLLAAAALLAFSLTCRVQIGIRFFLPLIALASVGVSISLSELCRKECSFRRRWMAVAMTALVGWSAAARRRDFSQRALLHQRPLGIARSRLRAFERFQLRLGPGDSGIGEMAQTKQVPRVAIWYFGTDPAADRELFLRVSPIGTSPSTVREEVKCRYLAVGTTILYGSYVDPEQTPIIGWLRRQPIVDRTQTFLIFDLDAAPADPHAIPAGPNQHPAP